jgi:proteasome lid subunit RPN8/RPN11
VILLPAALLRRIKAAAQAAYPEECCGLLIGFREPDGRVRVTQVAESANVAPPPRRDRFEVDPSLRFSVMRRQRGSREEIVGHYHSHPDGPARPSTHDAASAYEPELVWLIVAIAAGRSTATTAWLYDPAMAAFRSVLLMEDQYTRGVK